MRIARTQPPAGYRVALSELLRAVFDSATSSGSLDAVLHDIAIHFAVREAFAVSSGKAALTSILLALKSLTGRRKVIIPAYTCYSVPSAIIKAGLEPVPCEIARGTFDYDYDCLLPMLGPDVLCVLSVHLFGIPSDTPRLTEPSHRHGVFVVEDAAQAMGGARGGRPLGTMGDVGFFSLGRGKNITCGSGGIIVTGSDEIARAIAGVVRSVPSPSFSEDARTFAAMTLMAVLISPRLYWLPAGLPFLRLGETIFHHDFPVNKLSTFQSALLRRWPERLAALNVVRRTHAEFYGRHIAGARDYGDAIPYVRFPVVLDQSRAKRRILAEDGARALGISGMYPGTIGMIPELKGRLSQTAFPEAERVAASLITLPTHPLLTEADRVGICGLVNQIAWDATTHRDAHRPVKLAPFR